MEFNGTVDIQAPRQAVWDFLTDAEEVSQCAPGLESLEVVEGGKKFLVVASIGLGNIKARFNAEVEWLEMDAPHFAKMKAHGDAPGSAADVISEMVLEEKDDGGTELGWKADINIVGTIASLAARMMGGVTQKMTGDFFDCVRKKIEA
ncbi:MAG: carbon monoxide dehydrogenase subunit G [Anaerolineae bacterium]|nr:carbon monoxide dehydrogenase subunit G [Anaerolineae bacterium]